MSRCPVCGETAGNLHAADCDGDMFDCEARCGRFNVVGSVKHVLENETLENRKAALEKAKRWSNGDIPSIDTRCI